MGIWDNQEKVIRCPKCHALVYKDDVFCPKCKYQPSEGSLGAMLESAQRDVPNALGSEKKRGPRERLISWGMLTPGGKLSGCGGCLILATVLLGGSVLWYLWQRPEWRAFEQFYVSVEKKIQDPQTLVNLRIKKKVIILDENKKFDLLTLSLPDDLRARYPREVETVILLERKEQKIGVYQREGLPEDPLGRGAPAIQRLWELTIIDVSSASIIGRHTIHGEPPPQKTGRIRKGPWPKGKELVSYVTSLTKS